MTWQHPRDFHAIHSVSIYVHTLRGELGFGDGSLLTRIRIIPNSEKTDSSKMSVSRNFRCAVTHRKYPQLRLRRERQHQYRAQAGSVVFQANATVM